MLPFARVSIIGLGLIGSSLARAIRAKMPTVHITGTDADPAVRERVRELDLVDDVADSPGAAVVDADLVVLAAAIEPDKSARPLATMLTASMDTNDFFTEAHPKLRPVESPTAGIYLSGACQGPKDIPDTVAQAGAAASKVIGLLAKDKLTCNPCVAHSDEMMCNGCSSCEKVCPYGAISYQDKEFRMPNRTTAVRRVAVVNEAVCQGCGACTVTCPSGAMDLKGFSTRQIMAEVDAICR